MSGPNSDAAGLADEPLHVKVNGDDIELHYGDRVETLAERLERHEREIQFVRRLLYVALAILVFHAVVPEADLFNLIVKVIGG